jgi:hypothetical protein
VAGAGGDGENNDLAHFAVDGVSDGDQVWRTECYRDEMAKAGVGIIVSATEPAELAALTVFSKKAGWRASVYGSTAPGDQLAGQSLSAWGEPIAELVADQPAASVALDGAEARSVLVFFTSVVGIPTDNCFGAIAEGAHRVDVTEIQLLAA